MRRSSHRPRSDARRPARADRCCPPLADDPAPKPKPNQAGEPVANTVKLDLQISGVASGWKVQIKPAHPGSRFKPVAREIEARRRRPDPARRDRPRRPEPRRRPRLCLRHRPDRPHGRGPDLQAKRPPAPPGRPESVPELSKTFYLRTTTVASKDTPDEASELIDARPDCRRAGDRRLSSRRGPPECAAPRQSTALGLGLGPDVEGEELLAGEVVGHGPADRAELLEELGVLPDQPPPTLLGQAGGCRCSSARRCRGSRKLQSRLIRRPGLLVLVGEHAGHTAGPSSSWRRRSARRRTRSRPCRSIQCDDLLGADPRPFFLAQLLQARDDLGRSHRSALLGVSSIRPAQGRGLSRIAAISVQSTRSDRPCRWTSVQRCRPRVAGSSGRSAALAVDAAGLIDRAGRRR